MTNEQEQHLQEVVKTAGELIEAKYRAGQEAHGGNLFDLSASELADESIMEIVDLLVYILTLKAKLKEVKGNLDFKTRK